MPQNHVTLPQSGSLEANRGTDQGTVADDVRLVLGPHGCWNHKAAIIRPDYEQWGRIYDPTDVFRVVHPCRPKTSNIFL